MKRMKRTPKDFHFCPAFLGHPRIFELFLCLIIMVAIFSGALFSCAKEQEEVVRPRGYEWFPNEDGTLKITALYGDEIVIPASSYGRPVVGFGGKVKCPTYASIYYMGDMAGWCGLYGLSCISR